ncbi:MAG: hypothetical protein Q9222_002535 [Ikaeria aurantiellina]
MRFLNATTLEFESVADSELHLVQNEWAILSHRWGADEDEISYDDIQHSRDLSTKISYGKIRGFGQKAVSESCKHCWIDTACINKQNSSELSEAINSMYQWYRDSKVCIVYLEDVPSKPFSESEWFTRGWTLQELIAPESVTFYDREWNKIGTKADLMAELVKRTGIPEGILNHTTRLSACSIAQRISWAAERRTTRVEDSAYSLMGLFDIYMPMIYGERDKAFLRLQEHIIQKSKDESIFAWPMDFPGHTMTYSGAFAPSPLAFSGCGDIIQMDGSRGFSETNGDLCIWSKRRPYSVEGYSVGGYRIMLHCTKASLHGDRIFILVARTSAPNEYVRVRDTRYGNLGLLALCDMEAIAEKEIRLPIAPNKPPLRTFPGFKLRKIEPYGHTVAPARLTVLSNTEHPDPSILYQVDYTEKISGIVRFDQESGPGTMTSGILQQSPIDFIKLGFDPEFNPVIWLIHRFSGILLERVFEEALASGPKSKRHRSLMNVKDGGLDAANFAAGPSHKIIIDREKGLRDHLVRAAKLRISMQLETLDQQSDEHLDPCGLPVSPMKIWVVDVIALQEQIAAVKEEEDQSFSCFSCFR